VSERASQSAAEVDAPTSPSPATTDRLLELLRVLVEGERGLTAAEIAKRLSLARATTHRFLQVLQRHGMAEYLEDTRRYVPGGEFVRLAALVSARDDLAAHARPVMVALAAETGEEAVLAIYRPHDRRVVWTAREAGARTLGYTIDMHRPVTPVWGASGRAILAHVPADERRAILRRDRDERSPTFGEMPPKAAEMERELTEIRRRGYAVSLSQRIPHAFSLAAPVLGSRGEIRAALSVSIPEMRVDDRTELELGPVVAREAERLSSRLGWNEHRPTGPDVETR
jgi:DNA-binding IclR family transcriptional regulator